MEIFFGKAAALPADVEQALARFRYRIFVEKLGWDLPAREGLERDQFDHEDAVYVVALDDSGDVAGCARLLPTTRPYLLSEIFPALIDSAEPPKGDSVWELSRFAVRPEAGSSSKPVPHDPAEEQFSSSLCKRLLAKSIASAAACGATQLVTVSPIVIERLLSRMGVVARRAGKAMKCGSSSIGAYWFDFDHPSIRSLVAAHE